MPQNAAQVMSGCHPQVGGGLRSFYAVTSTYTGTGLTSGGGLPIVPAGFDLLNRISGTGGPVAYGDSTDFLLAGFETGSSPPTNWNLYRLRQSVGNTNWSRFSGAVFQDTDTFAPPGYPGPRQVIMVRHGVGAVPNTNDTPFVSLSSWATNAGIYSINIDDTANGDTQVGGGSILDSGYIATHQARLIVVRDELIYFSSPGVGTIDLTGTANNFISIDDRGSVSNAAGGVTSAVPAWVVSIPPSDLLVCSAAGRLVNIQGDLADPTVREVGRWAQTFWHEPVLTPKGVAALFRDGVYLVSPDGTIQPLSPSIDPWIWGDSFYQIGMGQLTYLSDYLFAPNQHTSGSVNGNGTLVHDFKTGAWFTSTHSDDRTITGPTFMRADLNVSKGGIIWILAGGIPGAGAYLHGISLGTAAGIVSPGAEIRNPTWEWKSAPFRDLDGRQIEIREVHLNVFAHNSASTMAVTVNGVTRSETLPAGRSVQVIQFKERAAYLDVNIKSKSNASNVEAPILEALRVGWLPGHRLY